MRSGYTSQYQVSVKPDGEWLVTYVMGYEHVSRSTVASGNAEDQLRGELEARCAIEDHKAERAKASVKASGVKNFTVAG